jgi:UDP-N-acetylglucosamine/UDP-N-acetylgalactosamine 4-epimerase
VSRARSKAEKPERYAELCTQLVNEPRRWLVTGTAGFIGSALMERLLDLGQSVVGVDNFITGHKTNLEDVLAINPDSRLQFKFIEGDLVDPEIAREVCKDVDVVIHQAALGSVPRSIKDPLASHAANVTAFLNVLTAAKDAGVKRVVYASSSSVYGDHPGLPKVEDRLGNLLSPYAATKRVDEIYAKAFHDVFEMEIVGLRYFNVFGRRQDPKGVYAAVVPRWIDALIEGKPCVIFGDGSNSRDFCYVDNVVQANLLAATAPAETTGTVYNVGCNGRTDLLELFAMIRDCLAPDFPEVANAEPVHESPRPGDVAHSQASIDKIVDALGYAPTHQIADGMAETVQWFVNARAERA